MPGARRDSRKTALAAAALPALAALLIGAGQSVEPRWNWGDATEWRDNDGDYARSQALCRAVRAREPPAAHRPPADSGPRADDCDSGALYYGHGGRPDPARARRCAFLEAEAEQPGGDWPFGGRAMLMTIYANGAGVPRDLDLAIRYACELNSAPAESHGRVMHLAGMKGEAAPDEFHYCDDVTSGLAGGQCAAFEQRRRNAGRAAELRALTAGWSAAERAALARLAGAFSAFEEALVEGEVDLRGTLRGAFAVAAEDRLRDQHLDMLRRLARGRAPRFGAAQLQSADARLNRGYRSAMAGLRADSEENCCGAPTAEGLRRSQRAWLRYRDAFIAFAAVKFPDYPRAQLVAWLIRNRLQTMGAQ